MNATALHDQYTAAERDAVTRLDLLGAQQHMRLRDDEWLAAQATAVAAALDTGTARCCPHLTGNPAVIHAAVWRPGHLVCDRCVMQLKAPTLLEDSTCDRCRRLVRTIHASTISLGPVLLSFGLCTPCSTKTPLHPGSGGDGGSGTATSPLPG